MIRKLKFIVIAAAVLITLVLVPLLLKLDSIVRSQVVIQSSAALNVPTSLKAAHVSIMSESIGLLGFQIASPSGFSAPALFSLDAVHLDLNVAHLRAQPLTIDRLILTGPTLIVEQSGGKLNLSALTDQPSKPTSDGGPPRKLIIKELSIEMPKVVLRPGIPGIEQDYALTLPTVTLRNVGTADSNQNGVEMKDALLLIINTLGQQASESEQVPQEVRALLKLNVKDVVQGQVDQLKKKANDQINQSLDHLLKKVK